MFRYFKEKKEKKRLFIEEEIKKEEEIRKSEIKKEMETINYLENGGVELETKKLITKFIKDEDLYNRTFRLNEYKIGVFFNYDEISDLTPYNKNYYKGAVGIILKKTNKNINYLDEGKDFLKYRIVAMSRKFSSTSYGKSSHTSSYWEVNNEENYDYYKKIPNLLNQQELKEVWKKINHVLPEFDDF